MRCERCGFEMTEDMFFCPRCGEAVAIGKVIASSPDIVIRTRKPDCELTKAQWELLGDFACKFSDAGRESCKSTDKNEAEADDDGFCDDTMIEQCFNNVRDLCRAFLTEAEAWMYEHTESSDYSKRSTMLYNEVNAIAETPYVCCDVYGDGKVGYVITYEGFYFKQREKHNGIIGSGYSFEQLEEADIRYENGYVHVCDDCVYLELSEWEAKKLCDLLKAIVREFEVIRD